jgi:hypothetical protein
MKFDRSKGHCKQFCQAVFGFPKSIIPSVKYRKGGCRVNSHLHPLFAITTGWAGEDKEACILRFYRNGAKGVAAPPVHLQPCVSPASRS